MTRALIVAAVLASTTALTRPRTDVPPMPAAVASLPYAIGTWRGAEATPLDARTMSELGADAYITRTYVTSAQAPVDLYVAYYAQQRPATSIHSPLHCLPGTGWEPSEVSTVDLGAGTARRMVIQKNLDRALVLYWYAIHGRTLGSEIASKLFLLHDSLRFHRNDAALVRIVVPIIGSVADADREAAGFAQALLPHFRL